VVKSSHSLNRRYVEAELSKRGSTLADFLAEGQAAGRSLEDLWVDLRNLTGVPFSVRTLYRWTEKVSA
jgi:hypothetical protein